jgi:hypothetical protein
MPEKGQSALPLERIYLRSGNRIHRTVVRLTGISPISENTKRQLVQLGAKVGLSASEVNAAVAEHTEPKPRPLPRWAAWVVCIGVLAISLIVAAGWINYVHYATYIPGTRYGAPSPRDFRGGYSCARFSHSGKA